MNVGGVRIKLIIKESLHTSKKSQFTLEIEVIST